MRKPVPERGAPSRPAEVSAPKPDVPVEPVAQPEPAAAEVPDPISDALATAPTEREAVRRLLKSLSDVPVERQPELFSHVMNLLPDEDFSQVRPILLEPRTPRDVLDVIYADVLNRPDAVKLPLLLDIAFLPGHPLAGEAKETLSFLFGSEGENDPQIWRQKIAAEIAAGQ